MIEDKRLAGVIKLYSRASGAFNLDDAHGMDALSQTAARMITWRYKIRETEFIKDELDSKEIIERAKNNLMVFRGINSEKADKLLYSQSLQNKESIRTVAEAILFYYQTFSSI